jgi:phenylacetate-coenzyme A ligase PaaK-like adenylate-forming protein
MTSPSFSEAPAPEEFLTAALEWHFSPETGSRFWLQQASQLDFDPRQDVRTFDDLKMFPDLTNLLREVPVRDLIPRGYGDEPEVVGIFDSGGTTGPPKRIVLMRDFCDLAVDFVTRGYRRNTSWLAILPSGPHIGAEYTRRQVAALGGLLFTVDMDPRWVKRLIGAGRGDDAESYAEHLIDQAGHVLRSQEVDVLSCTPPILERLCRRDELIELVREKVEVIEWGGAHMDADTRYLYRTEVFPGTELNGVWGSTMALGLPLTERRELGDDDPCIYDPFSPYITVEVVDPETRGAVAYGERGQLLVHCVTKSFFLPNNLERDMATRVQSPPLEIGDSFADVTPLPTFDGGAVIEGVY